MGKGKVKGKGKEGRLARVDGDGRGGLAALAYLDVVPLHSSPECAARQLPPQPIESSCPHESLD